MIYNHLQGYFSLLVTHGLPVLNTIHTLLISVEIYWVATPNDMLMKLDTF